MTEDAPRHPEARIMAAFVEGTLTPDELAQVSEHLRDCGDCRTVIAETARFEREEQQSVRPSVRRPPWWFAAAAAIAAIAVIPLFLRNESRRASPIDRLIAASPREHRTVDARLAGFRWARLQAPARGEKPADPADMKLIGAAGEVLEKTTNQKTTESDHAAGVAYLLTGRRAEAIAALERAANRSENPQVWNDLAAARYSAAAHDDHPSQLPEALADADHALRLDPKFAEALFNRALILEAIGLREQARKAWQRYLDVDPSSDWSVEAREHLRRLGQSSQRFDPKLLERTLPATLVRDFPQEARASGEGTLLAKWADDETAQNKASAASQLSIARNIGQVLAASNGEHLLGDAVAAVDRAAGTTRTTLIEAHRLYRDARIDYFEGRVGRAEDRFRRSADMFARAASPMAQVASYYAASATLDQNRGAQAHDELVRILERTEADRHRAFVAQIRWTLAVEGNSAGDWGTGVREAEAASKIFRALGEKTNAAFVDSIAAHALELIGDGDLAWIRRLRAIGGLCGGNDRDRCNKLLHDAATTLAAVDRPAAAAALIDLTLDDDRDTAAASLAPVLAKRARVVGGMGDVQGARRSLEAARIAATRIPDSALRAMTETQIAVEAAVLQRATDPRAAISALGRALAFFDERRLKHFTPYVRLQRARAHRSVGDEDAAAADYASALAEIEQQRRAIGGRNLRLAFVDTAAEVIEETIDLHLSRGQVAAAFRVADRQHALVEPHDPDSAGVSLRVPADVAVIEYAVLPHSLIIFCISNGGISQQTVRVERRELAARISSFAANIRRRAPVEQINDESAALYRLLIAPLAARIAGARELVIIPDRQLYTVPFPALYDVQRGRYLIEQFSIRLSPSASVLAHAAVVALSPALIVADPVTPHGPRLAASRDEAGRIAALYGGTLLTGEAATRDRFVDAAKGSALIHYAGHADSDAGELYGALLLAGTGGILGSSDIARLSLARQPLVILAACGTFRGDTVHAAGMSSLARAFLMAGARGVVGTLWEIDDDVAAPLFLRFHEELRAGVSPARALREAQIEMLHSADARLHHPATWSPIELLSNL